MSYQNEKPIPFTEKDVTFWREEIRAARQKRQEVSDAYGWDDNLKRYTPQSVKGVTNNDINIGVDFADVERKKAALFYDTPKIGLTPTQDREIAPASPTMPALTLSTLLSWHQDLLNTQLGPQHADVKHAVMKAIFDCLCPAGVGPVTVGYQVTMRTEEQQTPELDELGMPVMDQPPLIEQAKAALGLAPPPMPVARMKTVKVEVPIHERWFVSHFSPKALLIPASFKDTKYSQAPWIGRDWRKPASQVRRENPKLPKDWTGRADDAVAITFEEKGVSEREDAAGDPYVTGVELYYRTATRSDTETHPEAMRKLVLVDGMDEPLEHCDSAHQEFLDTGELSRGSLIGFCDRPLVLRQLSDSAWIPSDCAVTAQLTKEGEKYRTQVLEQRDGSKQVIAFDSDIVDPTALDKIKKAHGTTWVPLKGGALSQGIENIMAQVAQPTNGRETYMGMDVITSDREKILGISANQSGIQSKSRKTATEQTIVQRNSEARFEQERQRVLEWFLDIVKAFDTLFLRYADARVASEILGETRGQLWAQYKDHLLGGYSYELSVDSGKYLDIEADRRQILQFYGQVRQDPFINPRPILTQVAQKFGFDPAEFIVEPQKPEKELKATVSIKGELLDPALPQFPIMIDLLRQGGWVISEESVKIAQEQSVAATGGMMPIAGVGPDPKQGQSQPQHPGMMEKAPTINQHVVDESGDRSGPKVVM